MLRDGVQGATERAPFDRIVATVGCSDLSPNWAEQLAEGGVLLVPLAHAGGHPLYLLRKEHGRLGGRVASWTGFMPIRGPLHIEGLWPMGVVQPDAWEPIQVRDPWPGFGAAGSLPSWGCSADEIDFCFYLSLLDRRACWAPYGVGLSDGLHGWAVAGPDGIRWWKNPSLMEQLDRLHADWLARGRPRIGDYQVAFVPIGQDAGPPPGCLIAGSSASSSGSSSPDLPPVALGSACAGGPQQVQVGRCRQPVGEQECGQEQAAVRQQRLGRPFDSSAAAPCSPGAPAGACRPAHARPRRLRCWGPGSHPALSMVRTRCLCKAATWWSPVQGSVG
jgi:hypothetical protein